MLPLLLALAPLATPPGQEPTIRYLDTFDLDVQGEQPTGWYYPTMGPRAVLVESPEGEGLCTYQELGEENFSNLIQSIPIEGLAGHGVRFTVRVRVQKKGHAMPWLRFDYADGTSVLADNYGDRKVQPGDWVDCEIIANLEDKQGILNMGLMGFDGADLWADDFQIEDLGPSPNSLRERARAIESHGLANLMAFSRLFGYVRYFHPSDEGQEVDWETLAIEGVRRVEGAETPEDLAAELREIFAPIAPTLRIGKAGETLDPAPELQRPEKQIGTRIRTWVHNGLGLKPGIYSSVRRRFKEARLPEGSVLPSQVIERPLERGLLCLVPHSLWTDRKGTLPSATAQPTTLGSTWEVTGVLQSAWSADDRGTRLAVLILAWNVFQHFYPYFDVVDVDWKQELEDGLQRAALDKDSMAFESTLKRLVAALQDGHGWVSSSQSPPQGRLPLQLVWAGDQLVVSAVHADFRAQCQPGDLLVGMDDKNMQEVLADKLQFISSATPQWAKSVAVQQIPMGPLEETVELHFLRGESRHSASASFGAYRVNPWQLHEDPVTEVEPGFWYFDMDRATTEDFKQHLEQLSQAKGIVFDLRGYPRGLSSFEFFPHIIDDTIHSAWWRVPIVNLPDREDWEWRETHWTIEPKEPRIQAKLAFLTGGGAISYAESCMGIVEHYKLGEIVGGATAGTNGNVNPFRLPGGFNISWTGMKVDKQDRTPHHGVGILPTIPVELTPAGIASGRDEVFEAGLAAVK